MKSKTIAMPITVPVGKYCYDMGMVICEHLDSNGYGTGCSLRLDGGCQNKDRKERVLKPKACIQLLEIK